MLGETITDLLEPWPLKVVFDYVLGSKKMPQWLGSLVAPIGHDKLAILEFAALAVVSIAMIGAVSTYLEKYLTTSVGQWVMHDLRRTLYHHIQRLSLTYHDHKKTGDLISRVTSDIDAIQDFVSQVLLGMVVNVLTLLGMLVVMFYLDWRFTLIALSVAPILFIVVYSFTRRIKQASRAVRKKGRRSCLRRPGGALLDPRGQGVFPGRLRTRAFRTTESGKRRNGVARSQSEGQARADRAGDGGGGNQPGSLVRRAPGAGRRMTAGSLLVFLLYLGKMYKPMRELSKMTDTLSKTAVGYERIREVLETERDVRDVRGARPARISKGRSLLATSALAIRKDEPILTDVDFRIEPGQIAAFVGPTGAGKTTIASLVARFYDPLSGTVMIDGRNTRHFTLQSLRSQISFVLQETLLFRAPSGRTLPMADRKPRAKKSSRRQNWPTRTSLSIRMSDGYDTMVGERGVTLSGGQRQRIAIARAIIRKAPILILDEPSSGLDAASEEVVFEALGRLMEGKTAIVIAHRLATVRRADVIFVVDEGRIVERGTHEELLGRGGLYAELHEIQFRSEDSVEAVTA